MRYQQLRQDNKMRLLCVAKKSDPVKNFIAYEKNDEMTLQFGGE